MKKKDLAENLKQLLAECRQGKRSSRAALYREYYNYAISICLRYSHNREEAQEIVNDGFVKVFVNLDKYTDGLSFKGWVRRIMINAAIDFYRKHEKHNRMLDIEHAETHSVEADGISQLTQEEIMAAVQHLPPSYRFVFNLYVIEGYKHDEISTKLGISTGTSKSHLAKARARLKKYLEAMYNEKTRSL